MSSDRQTQLDHLFENRKLLIDVQRDLRKSIDQAIRTLSGAALGLSLTVIKDVAKAAPVLEWALALSRALFGISLFATLFAMWATAMSAKRNESITLLHYNALLLAEAANAAHIAKHRAAVRRFGALADRAQYAAAAAFGGGILSTGIFVFWNLP